MDFRKPSRIMVNHALLVTLDHPRSSFLHPHPLTHLALPSSPNYLEKKKSINPSLPKKKKNHDRLLIDQNPPMTLKSSFFCVLCFTSTPYGVLLATFFATFDDRPVSQVRSDPHPLLGLNSITERLRRPDCLKYPPNRHDSRHQQFMIIIIIITPPFFSFSPCIMCLLTFFLSPHPSTPCFVFF